MYLKGVSATMSTNDNEESDELQTAVGEVVHEINRQRDLWGNNDHHPLYWNALLGEEVGEVSEALVLLGVFEECDESSRKQMLDDYRRELSHVAAVAISAMASLERTHGGARDGYDEDDSATQ